MLEVKIIRATEVSSEMDELLWTVLWKPLGLTRDIRKSFKLADGETLALLAQIESKLIGGLVAVKRQDLVMELCHLAVASYARGCGVGHSLIKELIIASQTKMCFQIHTIARNTSISFFRKQGFQVVTGYVPEYPLFIKHGITFVHMEKAI